MSPEVFDPVGGDVKVGLKLVMFIDDSADFFDSFLRRRLQLVIPFGDEVDGFIGLNLRDRFVRWKVERVDESDKWLMIMNENVKSKFE